MSNHAKMHYSLSSQTFNWQQKSPTGFIRVKLIELDPAPIYNSLHGSKSLAAIQNVSSTIQLDPYCAISIKEKIGSKSIPKVYISLNMLRVVKIRTFPKISRVFNTQITKNFNYCCILKPF